MALYGLETESLPLSFEEVLGIAIGFPSFPPPVGHLLEVEQRLIDIMR